MTGSELLFDMPDGRSVPIELYEAAIANLGRLLPVLDTDTDIVLLLAQVSDRCPLIYWNWVHRDWYLDILRQLVDRYMIVTVQGFGQSSIAFSLT